MNIPYLAYQAASVHGPLWAINAERAEAMAALFATNPVAFAEVFGKSSLDLSAVTPAGVALIPVEGVLTRAGMPCATSSSTIDIRRALREAKSDPAITAGVLPMESPGGALSGLVDCADDIEAFTAVKPLYAHIPDMACSAAYWLASQCTEVWASPNATQIGNIGVRSGSVDVTKALEAAGVKVDIYASGPFKSMGVEGGPVTAAHKAEFQRQVDEAAAGFAAAVAKGRKMPVTSGEGVADGRWFTAAESLANGLIDKTGSLEELYQTISARQEPTRQFWQLSPAARPAASASLPTKPMSKIKELIAQLRGNPEMAQAAGITDPASLDAMEAEANATGAPATHQPLDPSVVAMIEKAQTDAASAVATANAQMAAVAAGNLEARAESFAAGLINDRKAHGAQKESLKTLYRTAAMADGGGAAKLDEKGALVEGQNVAAVVATFKDAPQHQHGTQQIPDGDPNAQVGANANGRDVLLKMTPQGRAILAREKN